MAAYISPLPYVGCSLMESRVHQLTELTKLKLQEQEEKAEERDV